MHINILKFKLCIELNNNKESIMLVEEPQKFTL